jgi:hypothetical protein
MPIELKPFSWERMIEAVELVRTRTLRATRALSEAGIPYAVGGGNAVAAWVARVDRAAVRNTQDVDILIRRSDFNAAKLALESKGFVYRLVFGVDCFLDGPDANPRDAVHILFAGEKVKPTDLLPNAEVTEREPAADYDILQLEALVRMKLTSYRLKDRVHLLDMISVKLIDDSWPQRFAPELAGRLQELLDDPYG